MANRKKLECELRMQRTRNIIRILPLAMFVLLLASFQMPVQAHTPSSMTLGYDVESDTLLVEVTHGISGDHRIAQIQIWKNDVLVNTRLYDPPQETTSGMDDTFMVVAGSGDVLKVTATCSISGSVTEEITVGVNPTTTTTDTSTTDTTIPPPPEIPTTLLIMIVVAILGVLALIVGVLRRR